MTRLFPSVAKMYLNFKRLAIDYGQWQSIKQGKATDAFGEPIPWYTYPAVEYLSSFTFDKCDVFEFGSGNSSLFWARRSRSIVSVEDNIEWFHHVGSLAQNNQLVIHRDLEDDYVRSLSEQDKFFHIIIIDGKWRRKCIDEAIKYLVDGGIIILDNADRSVELEASKFLRENNFLQIDFSGFGPVNGYCWTTSIFIKTSTTLQRDFKGPKPVGGLVG